MNGNSDRRDFIKKAALLTGAAGMAGSSAFAFSKIIQNGGNPLPKWKGFNLLDFFSPNPNKSYGGSTEEDFKWMTDWGFDFVRIPMAYPSYLNIDRSRDITPEEVFNINEEAVERVDQLVYLAHKISFMSVSTCTVHPVIVLMPDFMNHITYGKTVKPRKLITGTGTCGQSATKIFPGRGSALIC